jgi:PASTA domain
MPERWEREVGKLATLEAPPSTPRRIADGPHGDGMPPTPHRGQRILAGIVAFVVFGAAAVFAAGVFRRQAPSIPAAPDPATTVVVQLSSNDGPSATLEFDGQRSDPQVGPYCWNGTQRCADTALAPFGADDFVRVASGTPLALVGDDVLTSALATIDLTDDPRDAYLRTELLAPIDSIGDGTGRLRGRYVLTVRAEWPQGSVSFYFPVEIVSPAVASPASSARLDASLTAPSDGSAPLLTLSVHGTSMAFDAQDGRWSGASMSPKPIETFWPVVEPGATLAISTGATEVEGSLWIADSDQNLTGESMRLDLSSGSAALPSQPGFYRLTITESWPQGEAGFSVDITIGTPPTDWPPAPPVATVPDVVGLTRGQAVTMLTDAGFVSVSVAAPAGDTGGVVAEQDPAAGTQIETTTTIKLTVTKMG